MCMYPVRWFFDNRSNRVRGVWRPLGPVLPFGGWPGGGPAPVFLGLLRIHLESEPYSGTELLVHIPPVLRLVCVDQSY
jgi:hypothetical protein